MNPLIIGSADFFYAILNALVLNPTFFSVLTL